MPVPIPPPRFADKDFVQETLQSVLVATQPYPSSPDSQASMACIDLDAFSSECSRSSVSPVETDRVSISLVDSGDNDTDKTDNDKTNLPLPTSRSQPLNHSHSPVDISSSSQVVVESPSHYEAPAVPVNISTIICYSCPRYLPYHQFSCLPTGCAKSVHMTHWMCFRYSKCLRKVMDTYLLRHRSRHRLLQPHWAWTLCYRKRQGR